jgi:hypothetical protein
LSVSWTFEVTRHGEVKESVTIEDSRIYRRIILKAGMEEQIARLNDCGLNSTLSRLLSAKYVGHFNSSAYCKFSL